MFSVIFMTCSFYNIQLEIYANLINLNTKIIKVGLFSLCRAGRDSSECAKGDKDLLSKV